MERVNRFATLILFFLNFYVQGLSIAILSQKKPFRSALLQPHSTQSTLCSKSRVTR
jgi:hypothetical protein